MIDETAYKKKKRLALIEKDNEQEEKEKEKQVNDALIKKVMSSGDDIPHSTKIKLLGIPESTYYVKLREFREQNKPETDNNTLI